MKRIKRIKIVQVERRLTATAIPVRGKCPVCGRDVDTISEADAQELLEVRAPALEGRQVGFETHPEGGLLGAPRRPLLPDGGTTFQILKSLWLVLRFGLDGGCIPVTRRVK